MSLAPKTGVLARQALRFRVTLRCSIAWDPANPDSLYHLHSILSCPYQQELNEILGIQSAFSLILLKIQCSQ